jgi:putative ABC transport system permease protein
MTSSPTTLHMDLGSTDRAAGRARRGAMVMVGLRMMLHDRLKMAGTVFGVVFAVVLSVQQLGILFGLLAKNTMVVENAGAEVWIVPPGTEFFQSGQLIPEWALSEARVTPGVRDAVPLIVTTASVLKPEGGTEPVTLIGAQAPYDVGGPWNIVAGSRQNLGQPDTMFFEYSQRHSLGGLTLSSMPEVNGRRVHVAGFTWGLQAFAPSYAFADIDLARELAQLPESKVHFVLARVDAGADPEAVAAELSTRVPVAEVRTAEEFSSSIVSSLLRDQLGITFGTSTIFGLVVGIVIVALAMFSSVIDNLRQFGTLKALGAENRDLTRLVLVQAVSYGLVGSFIGLGVVAWLAELIRSPQLGVVIPAWLVLIVPVVMVGLCMFASILALRRIRRLEPGMVFR